MCSWGGVPPRAAMRPSRAFHCAWARAATWVSDQPGSSAVRFRSASRVLTNEMPTFIRTSRCALVSKVTNAPHDVPVQLARLAAAPELVHVPADENGRSNRAKKYSVYLVPVWQKP